MTKIFPFKGVTYNKKLVGNLAKVTTPPYDVISTEGQDAFYNTHPYNIIRLILGKNYPGDTDLNNKYTRASAFFKAWLNNNILSKDEEPAIYVYEQKFSYKNKKISKLGYIALFKIEEFEAGRIFPHENTLAKPKTDRQDLLRACSTNFEPIFSLYADEKNKITKLFKKATKRKPTVEVKDKEKVLHRLWKISSRSILNKITKEMESKQIYIADGHHRYEASLKYRNEMRSRAQKSTGEEPYNFIMMYFTNIFEKGLLILPIHRLVKDLNLKDVINLLNSLQEYFEVIEIKFTKKSEKSAQRKLLKLISQAKEGEHFFGMYINGFNKYYLLKLKNEKAADKLMDHGKPKEWRKLDVAILHTVVIKHILGISDNKIEDSIIFSHNDNETFERVKKGEFKLALFLDSTKVEQIIAVANKYEKMPQKSTFFYPKLKSGLVMYKMDFPEKFSF
ncbi:DUF1015 domain-containing protein [Candidatus Margulisiibacteriota bacterium]